MTIGLKDEQCMKTEALPDEIGTTRAARLLGVVPRTVITWTRQGHLRLSRLTPNGTRYYARAEVEALAEKLRRG